MKRLFKKAIRDLFQNKARLFTALMAMVMGSVVFCAALVLLIRL